MSCFIGCAWGTCRGCGFPPPPCAMARNSSVARQHLGIFHPCSAALIPCVSQARPEKPVDKVNSLIDTPLIAGNRPEFSFTFRNARFPGGIVKVWPDKNRRVAVCRCLSFNRRGSTSNGVLGMDRGYDARFQCHEPFFLDSWVYQVYVVGNGLVIGPPLVRRLVWGLIPFEGGSHERMLSVLFTLRPSDHKQGNAAGINLPLALVGPIDAPGSGNLPKPREGSRDGHGPFAGRGDGHIWRRHSCSNSDDDQ